MDSKSFTQTSFCDIMIDNITTNKDKEYILTQLSIMCNKKYTDRYARVYNDRFSKNINNPHLLCLKSQGTPYFMFITKISDVDYCFLIDKKIKEGYDYPKIFILPLKFTHNVYSNTLLECELIRDKNKSWYISIIDSYYMYGNNTKNDVIIDRINQINKLLNEDMNKTSFLEVCKVQVKRYFDYKDIEYINKEFIPLLPYNIRGYYFVPLNPEYSKMLYLLDRVDNNSNISKKKEINHIKRSNQSNKNNNVFRIIKTTKPDVYDLLKKSDGEFKREGILLVQTLEESHKLGEYFRDKSGLDEIYIECTYDNYFNKWRFNKFITN